MVEVVIGVGVGAAIFRKRSLMHHCGALRKPYALLN
jgi:hypothetical protein